jgi:hypothetical protein
MAQLLRLIAGCRQRFLHGRDALQYRGLGDLIAAFNNFRSNHFRGASG